MKVLYVLCVLLSVSVALGSYHSSDYCKYTNHKGERIDLHLLANHYSELQFYDAHNTKSTVYFNPCGTLYSTFPSCGANSSVCLVTSQSKEISYGSVSNVQKSETNIQASNGRSGSIELMFGNGEMCNNGLNRKSVVNYICNMNMADDLFNYPKISAVVEDCTITLTVETPYACPVANYCTSLKTDDKCSSQHGLCAWRFGRCGASGGCWGGDLTELSAGILSFIIVTFTGLLLICLCGLCFCFCKKSKRNCRAQKTGRCAVRGKKRRVPSKPKPEVEFDSFEMPPYQLVPGGIAPINPYSNIQGYPMVTLAAPDENAQL